MSDRDAPLGDDELLALLASSLEGFTFDEGDDPVPPAVEENSKWLHTYTQLEAELAASAAREVSAAWMAPARSASACCRSRAAPP